MKIVVGPQKGLRKDLLPFNIDKNSFPTLVNAYTWRGRIKRKRGTSLLGRLKRYFNSANTAYGSTSSFVLVAGAGNLISAFSLQSNANIVPGTVTLTDSTAANTYTDNSAGVLTGVPGGTGTINYATGAITISGGAGNTINAVSFSYYPDLPALGIRNFVSASSSTAKTIAFDTTYSYNINSNLPYSIYDVSFYKNPPSGTPVTYTQKTTVTPTTWNSETYQQMWTVNFQGALWATNGMEVPFDSTKISMQYKPIVAVTVLTPTTANLQITSHGLVVGDFVFINEVATTTGINFQTGYVTTVTDVNNIVVTFPNATLATNGTGGIAQYLTNRSDITKDCLRWYDGDPTNGNATTPTLNGNNGWVNFAPPLGQSAITIGDLPPAIYYLVGAKIIFPFKDRLLFLGVVVQANNGSAIYLKDTIVYSQNGTPYYTASFTGDAALPTTVFNSLLTPTNQTGTPNAYWTDTTGYGGFQQAGIDEAIITCSTNEDVLIVGFEVTQTRLVYTGNDIVPFNFFQVNSELGSGSTFSAINMDYGVISRGSRGFVITSQVDDKRIDLDIPDEVFQIKLTDNGAERLTAARDFINEWIYFTYPSNNDSYIYPTKSLMFNYRENSWSINTESYTCYGQFQKSTGYTWATIGTVFSTWNVWNEPWNAGSTTLLQPQVAAGNQQGFILVRDDGTGEGNSLYIKEINNSTINSPDHCLAPGDFIQISGCLGTSGAQVNNKIFSVGFPVTNDTFTLNPSITTGTTYLGGGVIKRIYKPFIQSMQFPVAWDLGRKTRLGVQQYLLSVTNNAQITLLIYLSQDSQSEFNTGPIIPASGTLNSSLIYSTILYTCPESANLGLTPFNTNLLQNNIISPSGTNAGSLQEQMWHRVNTSLIGDTVQIGFTLSEKQLRDVDVNGRPISQFEEIEIHKFILDVSPAGMLA